MDQIAAQPRKRLLRLGQIQLSRAEQLLNIMRPRQHVRFQLSQKRHGGHGIALGELPALEQHGFKLHHDWKGLFELPEEPEIRILAEHVRTDIVPVSPAQRSEMLVDHGIKARLVPAFLVRIPDLDPGKRDLSLLQGRALCDLQHISVSCRVFPYYITHGRGAVKRPRPYSASFLPRAWQALSASSSGASQQVTLSAASRMPAEAQSSSHVRIHSPSPQP